MTKTFHSPYEMCLFEPVQDVNEQKKAEWQLKFSAPNGYIHVSAKAPFTIHAPGYGFDNTVKSVWNEESQFFETKGSVYLPSVFGPTEKSRAIRFSLCMHTFKSVREVFHFPEDIIFTSASAMTKYLKEKCAAIFHVISINNSNKRLQFQMANRVHYVKFSEGLNFILGYEAQEFESENKIQMMRTLEDDYHDTNFFTANYSPQLTRGIRDMYVYASCCNFTEIGHRRIPLLKYIFVDRIPAAAAATSGMSSQQQQRHVIFQNPMYVNVTASHLNRIEISIRNDAGEIVSFPKGSVSVLTLHFKKDSRINYKQAIEFLKNL